jgi:hypothetical protein
MCVSVHVCAFVWRPCPPPAAGDRGSSTTQRIPVCACVPARTRMCVSVRMCVCYTLIHTRPKTTRTHARTHTEHTREHTRTHHIRERTRTHHMPRGG